MRCQWRSPTLSGRSERFCNRIGGGDAAEQRPVAGREEIRGTGFPGEEEPLVEGRGEIGAAMGMAGHGSGIAAAGMGIKKP
jgi:hypothetical protein